MNLQFYYQYLNKGEIHTHKEKKGHMKTEAGGVWTQANECQQPSEP